MNKSIELLLLLLLFMNSCRTTNEKQMNGIDSNEDSAVRSTYLIQMLDSFGLECIDTTAVVIRFDTSSYGEVYLRASYAILPFSVEEKQRIEVMCGPSDYICTKDDYLGYTALDINNRTILLLVRRGTMSTIPASILDSSLLKSMDTFSWNPTNYRQEDYHLKIRRYQLQYNCGVNSIDSIAMVFDGIEWW